MADQDLPLETDTDKDAAATKGSPKMMIIIIAVVVLLLISVGAAYFLLRGSDDQAADDTPAAVEDVQKSAIYMPIRPSFVVNFANIKGTTRFLQVEISLMGRDPMLMAKLENHAPLIKSIISEVISQQDFDELKTPDGKENLKITVLDSLQSSLMEELGDPTLEKVYFTSFVLQ